MRRRARDWMVVIVVSLLVIGVTVTREFVLSHDRSSGAATGNGSRARGTASEQDEHQYYELLLAQTELLQASSGRLLTLIENPSPGSKAWKGAVAAEVRLWHRIAEENEGVQVPPRLRRLGWQTAEIWEHLDDAATALDAALRYPEYWSDRAFFVRRATAKLKRASLVMIDRQDLLDYVAIVGYDPLSEREPEARTPTPDRIHEGNNLVPPSPPGLPGLPELMAALEAQGLEVGYDSVEGRYENSAPTHVLRIWVDDYLFDFELVAVVVYPDVNTWKRDLGNWDPAVQLHVARNIMVATINEPPDLVVAIDQAVLSLK